MSKKKDPLEIPKIVLPINLYIDALLRQDDYIDVDEITAQIIYAICKNQYLVHVQFPTDYNAVDIMGRPLTTPVVWRINAFRESTERWLKARKTAEEERAARHIYSANLKNVMKTVMAFTGVDEKFAQPVAEKLVRKNEEKKVIAMGGKPFYKTLDEL